MDQQSSPPVTMRISERCEFFDSVSRSQLKILRVVVCDPNADITLQSSDNILFKFYKKLLETHSGTFGGAEVFTATDEPVMFTEPSEIVDLLLQLMSLQEPPDLWSIDFNTLDLLTEAVEKYDAFASKSICRVLMR
jgi:hypothetical protein